MIRAGVLLLQPVNAKLLAMFKAVMVALTVTLCGASACGSDEARCDGSRVDPVLSSIQAEIFEPRCAFIGCHGGTRPRAGLDLGDATASFESLIDAPAQTTSTERVLVIPGNPDQSYLLNKLEGVDIESNTAFPETEAMPESGPLCASSIAAIRQWIADGSPP